MNNLHAETNEKMNLISAKIEVEGHILKVGKAMQSLKRNIDLLIDSVVHAQKGALQPQIISPATLMETLIKSVSAFPKDTALPIPMCKDSAQLLIRLYELQVYTKNAVFGFVILLPLVNRCHFNVYSLIPIPELLDRTKILYEDTGKSILWIDQARQYYFMTDEGWKDSCKVLNNMRYVGKQNQPLLSSHLHENCMVKFSQPRGSVPTISEKRIVEISKSI